MTLQEKKNFVPTHNISGADETRFLYCGDIDRAGFDIFLRLCKEAKELHIELFVTCISENAGTESKHKAP